MPGRSIATQRLYLQREVTPGVAVTNAMKEILGLRVTPGFATEGESYRASGYKVPTTYIKNSETGTHSVEAIQEFNSLLYVLTGGFGAPIASGPVAGALGNATTHTFLLDANGPDEKATFTAIWGDSTQAIQARHFFFNSLGMTIQRGALTLSTSAMSYKPTTGATAPAGTNEVQTVTITGSPTGGTFTLTYEGATTSALAYNASAAAVQTALRALGTIGSNGVTTAGGPFPGTAVTVTFTGPLAATNVAQMTAAHAFTGGTSPAIAVTTTTPGVPVPVVSTIPVAGRYWDVFADNTWAALGTTKLIAAYEGGVDFGDKYVPDWVINSALDSFDSTIESDSLEPSANLTLGFDATAVSLLTDWNADTVKFIRFRSTGPKIDATAAPADIFASLTIDLCVRITQPGEFTAAPNSPAVSLPFTCQLEVDPVSGHAARAVLVNTVTALA